jgi:hypothetical protein
MINIEYNDIKQILDSHGVRSLDEIEVGEPVYDSLFDYYVDSGEMPYGTMKARDGDPCEWITYRVADLGILKEETV